MPTQYSGREFPVDHPATYRIRVQGHIGSDKAEWFDGMTITSTQPEQQPAVTTLSGWLVDQAALLGILNSLYELRLAVLSVECLDEQSGQETAQ